MQYLGKQFRQFGCRKVGKSANVHPEFAPSSGFVLKFLLINKGLWNILRHYIVVLYGAHDIHEIQGQLVDSWGAILVQLLKLSLQYYIK